MDEYTDPNTSQEQTVPIETTVIRPRTTGAPLSAGASRHAPQSAREENIKPQNPNPERGEEQAPEFPSIQRAANMLRSALPFVQRLLPLIDGNVATAVGNLIAARTGGASNKPNLAPIEEGLADLRSQQHNLRLEVTEQSVAFKALEDQMERLREAISRGMLEQQESIDDLKSLGKRMTAIAVIALLLAVAASGLTIALYLHIKKVLP